MNIVESARQEGGRGAREAALYSKKEVPGGIVDPRSIPKIARWAAAAAVAIVLVVAGIFAHRAWLASRAMRHAPAAVPASVEQQSLHFTFSKVDGQQTVFTIRAGRATEFQGKKRSLLEDVDIVVYGEHGERHDEIHTHSCDYVPSTGEIVCHGEVALDLASAPIPGRPASGATGRIHIDTSRVHFDRKTGGATTDAPVKFLFPEGHGSAVGVRYSSRRGQIVLQRDVDLTLAPDRPGGLPAKVVAKGGLNYDRETGKLQLKGPVEITKGNRSFEAANLAVEMDKQLRPEYAVAGGGTALGIDHGARPANFRADRAEISFDGKGRAKQVIAEGHVVANEGSANETKLAAQRAEVTLDPLDQQPRDIFAKGNVRLESKQKGRVTRLRTAGLHLTTAPADPAAKAATVRLERATTDGRATVEWQSDEERLRLEAGELAAAFGAENRLRVLEGGGGVKLDRREPGKLPVKTTARTLRVNFSDGQWTRAEESGGVHATQGEREVSGQRARWLRTRDEMEIEGGARLNDPNGQTLADTILWNQQTGVLHASGDVRSTYFTSAKNGTGIAPSAGPANVVAQALVANPSAGEAVFTGRARLWQGSEMIQADRLDLRRASGELMATGHVLGAFPQARREGKLHERKVSTEKATPEAAVLWRVRADRLRYVNAAGGASKTSGGKATLDGNVKAWSSDGEIDASRIVLTMKRDARGRAELTQAKGDGGVLVRQGKRWGRAERALYDATAGKFVLSGGKPSLHDTSGDLVRGDQLTFYVADDTIQVESVKGSRTLTRHPIQKK